MTRVKVKICGLTTAEDAVCARAAGADYVGMVLSQGFGRSLLPDDGVEIGMVVEAPLVAVLVDESPSEAERIARLVGVSVIQLHGDESPEYVAELRRRGRWAIWKAVSVRHPDDVLRAIEAMGSFVDGLLLDGWHPSHPGGGGVAFSWEDVAAVRDAFPPGLDLIAAGGLTPHNVAEAVSVLRPEVVDVSSGVELHPRRKDHELVRSFIENAGKDAGAPSSGLGQP